MSEPVRSLTTGDLVHVRVKDSRGSPIETVGVVVQVRSFVWQGQKYEIGLAPTAWEASVLVDGSFHDLVEYRPYDQSHILMDWQIGQVVGINQTPTYSGVSETTYKILGPDGLGIQEIAGRNVRMISRPEGA